MSINKWLQGMNNAALTVANRSFEMQGNPVFRYLVQFYLSFTARLKILRLIN